MRVKVAMLSLTRPSFISSIPCSNSLSTCASPDRLQTTQIACSASARSSVFGSRSTAIRAGTSVIRPSRASSTTPRPRSTGSADFRAAYAGLTRGLLRAGGRRGERGEEGKAGEGGAEHLRSVIRWVGGSLQEHAGPEASGSRSKRVQKQAGPETSERPNIIRPGTVRQSAQGTKMKPDLVIFRLAPVAECSKPQT